MMPEVERHIRTDNGRCTSLGNLIHVDLLRHFGTLVMMVERKYEMVCWCHRDEKQTNAIIVYGICAYSPNRLHLVF
jgi:hypothetical protein